MSKKITNLSSHRQKKKPHTLQDDAKAAVKRFLDPEILDTLDGSENFTAGKATKSGSLVHDDDNIIDDEDVDDER